MSFGFGFALPSWKTLSGGFNPASLFTGGEQGVWYDPSDYSTLFQNSAGTTPVTDVEQFVGLMLDKSKGLVLGPELVTNGTFDTDTSGWALAGGTASVDSSGATLTNVTSRTTLSQAFSTTSGSAYRVTGVLSNLNSGQLSATIRVTSTNSYSGTVVAQFNTSAGGAVPFSFVFTSNASTLYFWAANNVTTAGLTVRFDNISVRELPGNHAFQTTSAKRPKLAARYNLLTRTEEFNDAAWTKGNTTVTANAATAPNGTTTADKLIPNSGAIAGTIYNNAASIVSGTGYTALIYVKAAELGFAFVVANIRASSFTTGVCVNLATGQLTNGGANGTYAVADAGNGWWRVTCTATASTSNGYLEVWPLAAAGTPNTYTGDGTSGIYIWGADLRPTSQATGLIGPTYQRVAAATVYDTAGFLPYLQFDGLSWSMGTAAINLTGVVTVNVFAGVRKLSDASRGIVVDHLDNVAINSGFNLNAPFDSTDKFRFSSFGSSAVGANATTGVDAPITVVASGIGSITQDVCILRLNGLQVASNTADQGGGGYGNNILAIGARNNASLFFTGWLTSLIVRGAQSTQSQIEATEAWVNGKTGAY